MKRPTRHATTTLATVLFLITAGTAVGLATADRHPGATLDRTTEGALAGQNDADGTNETVLAENLTDGGNVTVVNLGENATLGQVQGVSPAEPTVYVGPAATSGPNVTTGPNGTQLNVTQEFVLGGITAGWQGVAPSSIDGATDPTLDLTEGRLYAITWVNVDAAPHNVAVLDEEGTELAATEVVSGEGTAQTLVFRATSAGTYYCVVHPSSMRGDVQLATNASNA